MLTVATPLAQELSMLRSAAMPLNDAPYPTEVGTATETETSPDNARKRPFHSSDRHHAVCRTNSVRMVHLVERLWRPATPTS